MKISKQKKLRVWGITSLIVLLGISFGFYGFQMYINRNQASARATPQTIQEIEDFIGHPIPEELKTDGQVSTKLEVTSQGDCSRQCQINVIFPADPNYFRTIAAGKKTIADLLNEGYTGNPEYKDVNQPENYYVDEFDGIRYKLTYFYSADGKINVIYTSRSN